MPSTDEAWTPPCAGHPTQVRSGLDSRDAEARCDTGCLTFTLSCFGSPLQVQESWCGSHGPGRDNELDDREDNPDTCRS